MSQKPAWAFRRMQPGEMNIDPIEAEFFSTEALGSLADALVRECVQNSLDARRPGEQLTLRIALSATQAPDEPGWQNPCLAGLAPHLNAVRSGVDAPPPADEPLSCLVIEDFGTRGLQGDPQQSEDAEIGDPALRNDFFYFWRNIGRSRKQAGDLGRWGLGKTVFQAASRINAFFGLTVRADDGQRLLMGQSVLKIHKLGGHRYYPYGYFGQFSDDFALPLEDHAVLDAFCRVFDIRRTTEPGLSVVVPFPDGDITAQSLSVSLTRHYFMPIIGGELVVDVVCGNDSRRLDANTLKGPAAAGLADNVHARRLFDFARWAIELPKKHHVSLARPDKIRAPRWADEALDGAALVRLRDRFDAGEPVAVSVPVWVKPASGEPTLSGFKVYLERDESITTPEQHYVRDGITIAGVRCAIPRDIRVIVAVRNAPLSQLLGDSENPAHTEWQERSPKFKDRYRHGPFTLRYVKNAPREIVRLLTQPREGRDFRLLRQLFSLDVPTEDTVKHPEPSPQGELDIGTQPGAGEVQTVGVTHLVQMQKLNGGFRLRGTAVNGAMPPRTLIQVAYDVRRGDPFRRYLPLDFEMDQAPITVVVDGASVLRCQRNLLELAEPRRDFVVTVRGFDRHRDVRVKVVTADEEPDT